MEAITTTLVLLFAVVVSGYVSRILPFSVPRPLVQIALGSVLGLAVRHRVQLEPDIFFLLFLPPLLFLDGWRIPKEELHRDSLTILELAFGLVVVTVLGAGFFIHWMIPPMPLPVAFALAAVLSPTDPIAVSTIAARVPIPKRPMHILEGESLLNDASGLVCLRFAVAAALAGSFSLADAIATFFWLALGGVAVGLLVTWGVTSIKDWASARIGEESGTQILVSLLIPFGSYLLAEALHCSGILAAATSGITISFVEDADRMMAATRIQRHTVWDTIQFAANGVIFVLLGEQLPAILEGAANTVWTTGHGEPWWLLVYVFAITAGLGALRLLWVWASLNVTLFRAQRAGRTARRPHWRLVLAASLAGVRGAITLAGVLTLPVALQDGTPFPARELAIFLAMGVIILSLVAASIVLPLLLRGLHMPQDPAATTDDDQARVFAAQCAIAAVERVQHKLARGRGDADLVVDAAARIMDFYRARIDGSSADDQTAARAQQREVVERRLLVAAIRAERAAIFRLLRPGRVSSDAAAELVREMDLLETRFQV